MNPLNSPWNKPKPVYISDQALYFRWKAIEKHLTTKPSISATNGILTINGNIYIAKKSSKFRLQSHLDWAHYTPKTIANAIDNDQIESYYEIMLNDVRSDPNDWKDTDFEMELKTRYAVRIGRASLLK
jgi:hypothetical protein